MTFTAVYRNTTTGKTRMVVVVADDWAEANYLAVATIDKGESLWSLTQEKSE